MNEFANVQLDLIVSSLTNPRKTFDQAKLQELAESIKVSGVHQPIVVRKLPAARVPDTDRKVLFEVVTGERRYRASQLACAHDIPAMIRELTDEQVLEIQIVENLQREDLSELEEAEGYDHLMKEAHFSAKQVAEKIGKSKEYVHTRVKLLALCQEGRTALREGKLDFSRALVIARIPDSKLQIKAMKEIITGSNGYYTNGEPMSQRKALEWVQTQYMLKLNAATFKIDNADLVPAAGSCKTCTKRTGHDPDLFSEIKGVDLCIDPPCFAKKEEAQASLVVKEAKAKGQTVITGKEAQELALNNYNGTKFKGYRRLDSAEDSPTDAPLRKIIGEQMKAEGIKPVMIANPNKKGEMVACLPNEVAGKLLKTVEGQAAAAKVVTAEAKTLVAEKKAKAEAKTKAQFEKEWRTNLRDDAWVAMRDDGSIQAFNVEVHRYLVKRAANNLSTDDADAISHLLKLGKVAPRAAIIDLAKTTPDPASLHLLIIMQESSSPHDTGYDRPANEGLHLVAGNVFGKQLEEVIKEIKQEVKAKLWPKPAKKPDLPPPPLAQPKHAAAKAKPGAKPAAAPALRKHKMSAEEAKSGIAAAMQAEDRAGTAPPEAPQAANATTIAVGVEVSVVTDKTKLGGLMARFSGRSGKVVKDLGNDYFTVKLGKGGSNTFARDQIEVAA